MSVAVFKQHKSSRLQKLAISYTVSGFARISGLLVTLLTTPWLLNYLGKDFFGLWSILVQFFSLAAFTDFGLSNGLHNRLLASRHTHSLDHNRLQIQRTFITMTLIAMALAIAITLPISMLDWASLFSLSPEQNPTIRISLYVVFGIFYFNIPFTVIQKVQFAYMDHHRTYAWDAAVKLTTLLLIGAGINAGLDLPQLLALFFVPLLAGNILNTLTYRRLALFRISHNSFNILDPEVKSIVKNGSLFFTVGIFYALGRATDPLVIGSFGTLEQAADYQILLRLYDIPLLAVTMLTAIMWSAFGESLQRGDFAWIRTSLKRILMLIIILMASAITVYYLAGDFLLLAWLGQHMTIDPELLLALGIWVTVIAIYNLQSAFLNAAGLIKLQILSFILFFILGVPAKIVAITYGSLTVYTVAATVTFILVAILPSGYAITRELRLRA